MRLRRFASCSYLRVFTSYYLTEWKLSAPKPRLPCLARILLYFTSRGCNRICHCEGAKRLRQSKIKNGKKEKRLPRYARNDSFVLSFWSKVVLRFYFSAYAPCQNDKDDEAIESQQYDIKKACILQAFFTLKTEK